MNLAKVSLEDLKVDGLKKLCREKGLSDKGKKAELLDRLKTYQAGQDSVTPRSRSRSPKASRASEPSEATAPTLHGPGAMVSQNPLEAPPEAHAASSHGSGAALSSSPPPVGGHGCLNQYLERRNEERCQAATRFELPSVSFRGSGAAVSSTPLAVGGRGCLNEYLKRREEERRQAAAAAEAGFQRRLCPGCLPGSPLPCICGGKGMQRR